MDKRKGESKKIEGLREEGEMEENKKKKRPGGKM